MIYQTALAFDTLLPDDSVIHSPLVGTALPVPDGSARRLLGAYYTPQSAADYMADWVVRHEGEHIVEPSFGSGIFLRAVTASAARKNFAAIRLSGIEINEKALLPTIYGKQAESVNARYEDFLGVAPFKVQAIIGNPPYVRLRHLANAQRERALQAAHVAMGQSMDPGGSVWMPFVLHAMRFLDVGGRLAFVLPYDLTYVRYAWPLWKTLRNNFGSLHVLRTHERLFPDLLQDVVILLADDYGSRAQGVWYQAFERVQDLLDARPVVDVMLDVDGLQNGERAFIDALLGEELRCLLRGHVAAVTVPARKQVTFNIGYVAGDKAFFHPTTSNVDAYEIAPSSLQPSLTSTRLLKGTGLRTVSDSKEGASRLFLPDPNALTDGERRYIAMGQARGVASRYKCRVRDPWFLVPGVRVPDIILSVFSERPVLRVNAARCFASNSLLCGYCKDVTSEEIATSWYTSLTLLQCELEVHSLGGGVMVMVPREAGNVRLPKQVCVREGHLNHIDSLLRAGQTMEAYRCGDHEVLMGQLGFSANDIELIRQGIDTLTHWRTSARSSGD